MNARGVVVCLSLLAAGCAAAPVVPRSPMVPLATWPAPYDTPGTLGVTLEPLFGGMLQDCGIVPLDQDTVRTTIPTTVRRVLGQNLRRLVKTQEREAAERLLRYMFPKPDVGTYSPLETRRELGTQYLRLGRLPRPLDSSASRLYYQNCSTVLAAALTAGLNVPFLSVSAGARASVVQKAALGLVEGTFRSPLASGLLDSAPFDVRFPLLLDVWQWYRDNPESASAPPYYIDTFVGVAQVDYLESGVGQDYRIEGEIGGSFGVASARVQGQASGDVQARATSVGYTTHVYIDGSGREEVHFEQLPSIDDIVEYISAAEPRASSGNSIVLQAGATHSLAFSIAGVPPGLCEAAAWSTRPTGLPGTLERETVGLQTVGADRGPCSFHFRYTPDLSVFDANDQLFSGEIRLTSSGTASVLNRGLTLRFPVRLPTTEEPLLRQVGPPPEWSGTSSRLRWGASVQVLGSGSAAPIAPTGLEDAHLRCGAGTELPVTYALRPDAGALFTLEISSPRATDLDGRPDGSGPTTDCVFSAIAVIPTGNGALKRPLTVTVPVPSVAEASEGRISLEDLMALPIAGRDLIFSEADAEQLTRAGELTADDVVLADGSTAQASVRVSSPDFDPYLVVIGPDGDTYSNDDESDSSLSALVTFEAEGGGRYRIVVNTARSRQFGTFELQLRSQ